MALGGIVVVLAAVGAGDALFWVFIVLVIFAVLLAAAGAVGTATVAETFSLLRCPFYAFVGRKV